MSKNAENTITAEALVNQAVEENLVNPTVPAQETKELKDAQEAFEQESADEKPELVVLEGGKKSLKERLSSVKKTLMHDKRAQKAVIVGLAAGLAIVGYAKFVAAKAAEAVEEQVDDEDDETENLDSAETGNA